MKYRVYETVQHIGHSNNEEIRKEYVMDELHAEIMKQRLEAEDYVCDNGKLYMKSEGISIFRDDQVKRRVQIDIDEIAGKYRIDTNTKEWDDVRKALEIALTESSYEDLNCCGSSYFHDFEGDFIRYGFEEIEESRVCKLVERDDRDGCWDDEWIVELTDSDVTEVLNLKPEKMYEHMKGLIGVQTSNRRNPSYFAPKFKVGKFFISIQLNYYLWQIRQKYEDLNFDESVHNAVMTEEEFDKILPSCDNYLDVMFFVKDENGKLKEFGKADQMSLNRICGFLTELVTEGEIEIY